MQLIVGTLLLIFGLQWLRKAVLRASGLKAHNDEDETYREEIAAGRGAASERRLGLDWFGFVVSFKGVFLEGLEIVFIVITFGLNADDVPTAVAGAALAGVLVLGAGAIAHRPLARVPQNTIKFAVGLLLSTFGTFWAVEGLGVFADGGESLEWPGGDAALPVLLAAWCAFAWAAVRVLPRERADGGGALMRLAPRLRALLVRLRRRRRLADRARRRARARRRRGARRHRGARATRCSRRCSARRSSPSSRSAWWPARGASRRSRPTGASPAGRATGRPRSRPRTRAARSPRAAARSARSRAAARSRPGAANTSRASTRANQARSFSRSASISSASPAVRLPRKISNSISRSNFVSHSSTISSYSWRRSAFQSASSRCVAVDDEAVRAAALGRHARLDGVEPLLEPALGGQRDDRLLERERPEPAQVAPDGDARARRLRRQPVDEQVPAGHAAEPTRRRARPRGSARPRARGSAPPGTRGRCPAARSRSSRPGGWPRRARAASRRARGRSGAPPRRPRTSPRRARSARRRWPRASVAAAPIASARTQCIRSRTTGFPSPSVV